MEPHTHTHTHTMSTTLPVSLWGWGLTRDLYVPVPRRSGSSRRRVRVAAAVTDWTPCGSASVYGTAAVTGSLPDLQGEKWKIWKHVTHALQPNVNNVAYSGFKIPRRRYHKCKTGISVPTLQKGFTCMSSNFFSKYVNKMLQFLVQNGVFETNHSLLWNFKLNQRLYLRWNPRFVCCDYFNHVSDDHPQIHWELHPLYYSTISRRKSSIRFPISATSIHDTIHQCIYYYESQLS